MKGEEMDVHMKAKEQHVGLQHEEFNVELEQNRKEIG
jgi:hypothetical protein